MRASYSVSTLAAYASFIAWNGRLRLRGLHGGEVELADIELRAVLPFLRADFQRPLNRRDLVCHFPAKGGHEVLAAVDLARQQSIPSLIECRTGPVAELAPVPPRDHRALAGLDRGVARPEAAGLGALRCDHRAPQAGSGLGAARRGLHALAAQWLRAAPAGCGFDVLASKAVLVKRVEFLELGVPVSPGFFLNQMCVRSDKPGALLAREDDEPGMNRLVIRYC